MENHQALTQSSDWVEERLATLEWQWLELADAAPLLEAEIALVAQREKKRLQRQLNRLEHRMGWR